MKKHLPELKEYMPDLYDKITIKSLGVGWLHHLDVYSYNTGPVSEIFLERLKLFCMNSILTVFTQQYHCPVCLETPSLQNMQSGRNQWVGWSQIRIPGKNNIVYAASDAIYHYVKEHQYQPPQEFIDAVLHAPEPDSEEFRNFIKLWEPGFIDTKVFLNAPDYKPRNRPLK